MKRAIWIIGTLLILSSCAAPVVENGGSSSATSSATASADREPTVIASGLNIPWDIAFLPSGEFLVTERPGTLLRIGRDRQSHPIEGVRHVGEGGLLGITLHPDFAEKRWMYLYLTTNAGGGLSNRVERYTLGDDALTERTVILSDIPGAVYHDGGRIAFGPDDFLYITTGDAGNEPLAQDTRSLAGKILRVRDDGSIPPDNPFGNAVYSYGHRNPQGLAWDQRGNLWSTEHGRSGVQSGFDELNRIEKGGNYGWPVIQGSETHEGMIPPVLHSGSSDTWAPASAEYYEGSVFFGGLRGEALYEAVVTGDTPSLKTHLHGVYGRIRTVHTGPDGLLYITTSNRDGRGSVKEGDDKIIRIDPATLR